MALRIYQIQGKLEKRVVALCSSIGKYETDDNHSIVRSFVTRSRNADNNTKDT